ncbi:uncharacterized protein BP5553_05373 [Venustampulla echinocandica]|uniref:CCZ1/INTU/HSP4 first Longin domain-containing protein n=1 Tax=Venustampulla echinocandica TaxID=2656787 RepID=A0A370TQY9_9HELO|nr:uncharacterized protein BP5553_05373 [Venustampulla echinocandica]RDL37940.1 hypothetical protein BP5553_05373 [Venustampulla echinocandica]
MSLAAEQLRKTVPAQLGFLAIYNPSLGTTDETVADQIVYYTSQDHQDRKRRKQRVADASTQAAKDAANQSRNKQLRRIGLAQGMVEFGKSFADGTSIDTIETEKSRIILHEFEPGWWILASINLTILPKTVTTTAAKNKAPEQVETTEYSSREVKPAVLLLRDLLRAHSTFLLHRAPSIQELFGRTKRSEFENILGRYWDTFLSTWNVLMHGNPANNLYGGIKIAACGELGVGVGEEERGSGEREVLEGFVGRIDGLVDVIVSRFGDIDPSDDVQKGTNRVDAHRTLPSSPWLGSGNDPTAEDGVVFLGTGELLQRSLRDLSHWVEDIYRWGPSTYGLMDKSTTHGRGKNRKSGKRATGEAVSNSREVSRGVYGVNLLPQGPTQDSMTTIPPMPVPDGEDTRGRTGLGERGPSLHRDSSNAASINSESSKGSKFVDYLKFGYGSHWTLGGTTSKIAGHDDAADAQAAHTNSGNAVGSVESQGSKPSTGEEGRKSDSSPRPPDDTVGHYLIGLMGDIENEDDDTVVENLAGSQKSSVSSDNLSENISARTLIIELQTQADVHVEAETSIDAHSTENEQASFKDKTSALGGTLGVVFGTPEGKNMKELRVVVYANKPFIFVFLFEPQTESLASSSLYRSLHYQLSPLMKPLLRSTTFRASRPDITLNSKDRSGSATIYDLVWDPKLLTLNSTIPNIPDPFHTQPQSSDQLPWSRIEALNTHLQILNTYIATIKNGSELERTCKTSRGWWVVWTRIPEQRETPPAITSGTGEDLMFTSEDESGGDATLGSNASRTASTLGSSSVPGGAREDKVIFLIRKASDYTGTRSSRFVGGSSTAEDSGWIGAPGKLAQGIGIDTRKYIEGLLNLNR